MFRKLHSNSLKAQREKPKERTKNDPTPEQIRAYCEELQATWSEREKFARQHWQIVKNVIRGKDDSDDMTRTLPYRLAAPNIEEILPPGE